jgi:hypothetical protein
MMQGERYTVKGEREAKSKGVTRRQSRRPGGPSAALWPYPGFSLRLSLHKELDLHKLVDDRFGHAPFFQILNL